MPDKKLRMLRWREVSRRTTLGRTSIYAGMKEGWFPQSVKISKRHVAWLESEVDRWIQEKADARETVAV